MGLWLLAAFSVTATPADRPAPNDLPPPQPLKAFVASVTLLDGSQFDGLLYDVGETQIILTPAQTKRRHLGKEPVHRLTLPIEEIKHIRVERRGRSRRTLGLSLLSGMGVGAYAGWHSLNDERFGNYSSEVSRQGRATYGAFMGGMISGIATSLVNTIARRPKFVIKGSEARFVRIRPRLTRFSLVHQSGRPSPFGPLAAK
ncbi:MAG: hypothetical protein WBA12_15935 [Catalinimonas sp.]